MSVQEREVPFEVSHEGGFPTVDEFERVWVAIADALEFGVDRLFQRINVPIVEAYESEGQSSDGEVPYSYENVGLLSARATGIVEIVHSLARSADNLKALTDDVGQIATERGRVEHAPQFCRYGSDYVPSPEALERWGGFGAR